MQFYHWLVLIIVVLGVIAIFSHVAGKLARTAVTVIAIVLFAGFTWATIPEENKGQIEETFNSVKEQTVKFLEDVFNFGQTLPEKQEEAKNTLYE